MKEKITELRHLIAIFGDVFYSASIDNYEVRVQCKFNLKVIRMARHLGYTFNRAGMYILCTSGDNTIVVEI